MNDFNELTLKQLRLMREQLNKNGVAPQHLVIGSEEVELSLNDLTNEHDHYAHAMEKFNIKQRWQAQNYSQYTKKVVIKELF